MYLGFLPSQLAEWEVEWFFFCLNCLDSTGRPLLTWKSLIRFPLPGFLAYMRVSRDFCISRGPHCILLKQYYSVDFPWWFDRKTSFFSLLSKTWKLEKKSCQMTEIQNCTLWFDRKNCFCWILSACSSGLRFHINLEAKSMHGSSWKKNSIVSVFILVFAGQVLFTVNGLF